MQYAAFYVKPESLRCIGLQDSGLWIVSVDDAIFSAGI